MPAVTRATGRSALGGPGRPRHGRPMSTANSWAASPSRRAALLLAAAVAGLAAGLYPYSSFLLFSRGYYALDESRFPGLVALGSAAVGVALMAVAASVLDGTDRLVGLGLAHSAAYTVGALTLALGLRRRTGASLRPAALGRMVGLSAGTGVAIWVASRWALDADPSRLTDLLALGVLGALGGAAVLGGYRALHVRSALSTRTTAR